MGSMKNKPEKPIGYTFAKNLMPADTPEEDLLKAAENVANVVAALYRICDRLARENEENEIKKKRRR